jgi:hypothetical protein
MTLLVSILFRVSMTYGSTLMHATEDSSRKSKSYTVIHDTKC